MARMFGLIYASLRSTGIRNWIHDSRAPDLLQKQGSDLCSPEVQMGPVQNGGSLVLDASFHKRRISSRPPNSLGLCCREAEPADSPLGKANLRPEVMAHYQGHIIFGLRVDDLFEGLCLGTVLLALHSSFRVEQCSP